MSTFNIRFHALDSNDDPVNAGEVAAALVHGRGRVLATIDNLVGRPFARVEFDGDASELADERVESVRLA